MKNAKTTKTSLKKLSANDLRLKRFIQLKDKMKDMKKELDEIKEEIKHKGSHSTLHFIASISESERTSAPPIKTLVEKYGPSVHDICKTSTVTTINVSEKKVA